MIVVSQDGDITVPYENYMFKVVDIVKSTGLSEGVEESIKEGMLFWLVCIDNDGDFYVVGKYASKEKAVRELKIIYSFYKRGAKIICLKKDSGETRTTKKISNENEFVRGLLF